MSNKIREMSERLAMRSQKLSQTPHNGFVARVLSYDPSNDAIKVNFDHVDDSPQEPHWVPIMRQWVGNGYGMVGAPEPGMLAFILTVNPEGSDLVCLGWYFCDIASSMNVPSKEWWVQDSKGSYFKHTQDGGTVGDGAGAARMHGNKYVKHDTSAGHSAVIDDLTGTITHKTATNSIQSQLDDINKKISHIAATVSSVMDGTANKLTHAAGSVTTIYDGAGNTLSHVASTVGLGALTSALSSANAAINKTHLQSTVDLLRTQARTDLQALCTAMVGAGVTNAAGVFALLAALGGVTGSSGSSSVLIKS